MPMVVNTFILLYSHSMMMALLCLHTPCIRRYLIAPSRHRWLGATEVRQVRASVIATAYPQ